VAALLLVAGTWRQFSLMNRKQSLLSKVQAAQSAADENEQLTTGMINDYETFRPVFARQQNTMDILKTLALLEQSRSNRSFWFALMGDQQSYFTAPLNPGVTNKTARTNMVANANEHSLPLLGVPRLPFAGTNGSPAKPGMIAELCVPEEAEAARVTLSQVVKDLKQQPLFSRVDLLSDDQKRNIVDPKVIIPDKDFVLVLDFAQTDFLQPVVPKKAPLGPRTSPRRSSARPGSGSESETASQISP
jgi:hypothetical protein